MELYKKGLVLAIEEDTYGDYRKLLLRLSGKDWFDDFNLVLGPLVTCHFISFLDFTHVNFLEYFDFYTHI